MKLLLTSQSLTNDSLKRALQDMLGKPTSDCNAVYIPTGGTPVRGRKQWLIKNMQDAFSPGWKDFDILDLAIFGTWPKELWWPAIEKADVIFVGGGNSTYLCYWMHASGLAAALPELLKTKVYVGSSAGSMFLTPGLAVSAAGLRKAPGYQPELHPKDVPEGQARLDTLNLVPFYFRPHWNDPDEPSAELATEENIQKAATALGKEIYLVDDQTGLQVVDGVVTVVSEGAWKLIKP